MKKDLLSLLDIDQQDFDSLISRAIEFKQRYGKGIVDTPLTQKSLGLIFDKQSTRTRVSFETAMIQLGGHPIYMSPGDTQIARDEPAKDTARVLSRYIDCLVVRTFDHNLVEELAKEASIPVINALTDAYHPCQILSDLMTVVEKKGSYDQVKIAWVGDGNNVANSWVNAAKVLNLNLAMACPTGFEINPAIIKAAYGDQPCTVKLTNDPKEAVADADIIYTDVWISMGDEAEADKRRKAFKGFLVDDDLVAAAKKDALVMHCLPAHRGEEISESVLEGPQNIVWDQAENKRHMHKAILEKLILAS